MGRRLDRRRKVCGSLIPNCGCGYGLLLNFVLRLFHLVLSLRTGQCRRYRRVKLIQRFRAAARFSHPPQGWIPMA